MNRRIAHDGLSQNVLTGGFLRKGGINTSTQIQTRPPAPAPMWPAAPESSSVSGEPESPGSNTSRLR
jgi:hypothetical protein